MTMSFPQKNNDIKNTSPEKESAQFNFTNDEDTNIATAEEQAQWKLQGKKFSLPIGERQLLSDKGRKGPISGAQWPTHDIGDLLGEGGMAAVYLARRRDNGNFVALKILPARLAEDPESRKRFEREAQLSQTINSPHVVKVWSAGRYGPLCYLEMECIDGGSLGDEIKRRKETKDKPYTTEEVLEIALQTGDALLEAGKLNLVHRDIKPGNLMFTREGQVKLADFGIVKVLGEEAMTMAGTAMGTPTYMSPEQGRGDAVDARADYYSLGVVLYELLTLKQPFEESTADALIYQHHFVEPKLISDLIPNSDEGLQAVIFTCLQKFPDRRYPDAATLLRDLNLLKGGYPPEFAVFHKGRVKTGADEALARHGGGWRRYWKQALLGVAALVLVVGLGVWWLLASRAQADSLRGRLTVLDTPQAIPITAKVDVERLRMLVGDSDSYVKRWREKLAQVEQLTVQLNDQPTVALDGARIEAIQAALTAYQELCGSSEPLVTIWQARLTDLAREQREARQVLAELDQQDLVTKATVERLAPALAIARRLALADDPDIKRWSEKLTAAQQRLAELRLRLATIDELSVFTAAKQRSARDDLARWSVLMGPADNDGIRWNAKVTAAEQQLATLRQALAQFDIGEVLPFNVINGLSNEWKMFLALADTDDVDALRWQRRLQMSQEQQDLLAKKLMILDEKNPLTQDAIDSYQKLLDTYRLLRGEDDHVANWQQTITANRNHIATSRKLMLSLIVKEELTQAEQQVLVKAVGLLTNRRALDVAEAQRINERLARDEAKLVLLVERLAVLDQQADFDTSLNTLLLDFERLSAVDDPRRSTWRNKYDNVIRIRRRLSALDEKQPIFDQAQNTLDHLIKMIGTSPADVQRWQSILENVNAHKTALAALDVVGPIGDDIAERLVRLVAIVGESDVDVQRWQKKLSNITMYRERLAHLKQTYILPPTSSDDVLALKALVGEADPLVQQATERVRTLRGPERPAWASDFGRDEFGLYAEVKVLNQQQRFRYIPAGAFTLGSALSELGREIDEAPVAVRLTRSFWLADSECSQGLWSEIKQDNPAYNKHPVHPVERVSWTDAQHFLRVLNLRINKGISCRLPTEAEWEYAARAGATDKLPGHDAAGADDLDRIAIHVGTTQGTSRAIRGRLPNRLGLYDVLGNVWEWCQDTYAPYPVVPSLDPRPIVGTQRIVRGGSWGDKSTLLRVADRHALDPEIRSAYVGLRIAIDVEWKKP